MTLSPVEFEFFQVLDGELDKVEKFFLARQKEAVIFSSMLNEQLRELKQHRKLYHVGSPLSLLTQVSGLR